MSKRKRIRRLRAEEAQKIVLPDEVRGSREKTARIRAHARGLAGKPGSPIWGKRTRRAIKRMRKLAK